MIWINFDAWARALHLSMGSITWLLVSGAALLAIYRAGGLRRNVQTTPELQPAGVADAGVSAESESNG